MFTLSISLDASILDALKLELTKTLPTVKSSHRCEALARGLGYQTFASIKAAVAADSVQVTANGGAFSGYLVAHGFESCTRPLYMAVARQAMRAAMDRIIFLTVWGIGVGEPRRKEDGTWENLLDLFEKEEEKRLQLLNDYAVEAFLAALAFVSLVKRTKTVRPQTSSYWLKHIAENYDCTYPGGEPLGPRYVPNGALIAAAAHAGFEVRTFREHTRRFSLNATFNMDQASLIDLDVQIRPDGPRAEERRRREDDKAGRKVHLAYLRKLDASAA